MKTIADGIVQDMRLNSRAKLAFWLYNLSWGALIPLLRLNHRLAEGFKQRRLEEVSPQTADLWIQAASVGESFLAVELLHHLSFTIPVQILLTSNTSQGVEILSRKIATLKLKDRQIKAQVAYFPFDKPAIMQKAVATIKPKVMVLLETELWPGLLSALKSSGCQTLIINGRLTAKSLRRYLIWPSFWRFLRPDEVLAISEVDARRFARLFGEKGIGVMPNIKFDRIDAAQPAARMKDPIRDILPSAADFVVLGSVRHAEAPAVVKIVSELQTNSPQTIIGLFPRHLHRLNYWQHTLDRLKIEYALRSEIEERVSSGTVILWDNFGELPFAYACAKAAFVGGSLAPLGGQNFLEALMGGVSPIIGPSWENFTWVGQQIIDHGLVRIAEDWREAARLLIADLKEPKARHQVKSGALAYINERRGGTQQACRQIESLLTGR